MKNKITITVIILGIATQIYFFNYIYRTFLVGDTPSPCVPTEILYTCERDEDCTEMAALGCVSKKTPKRCEGTENMLFQKAGGLVCACATNTKKCAMVNPLIGAEE